jgi:hypothetical protein
LLFAQVLSRHDDEAVRSRHCAGMILEKLGVSHTAAQRIDLAMPASAFLDDLIPLFVAYFHAQSSSLLRPLQT